MSLAHIAAFALFMLPIVMMPGPDFALVTSIALKRGRLDGVFASIGVAMGTCFWGFVSVLGLAAVLQSSEILFDIVKFTGAAYLGYLGLKTLLAARKATADTTSETTHEQRQYRRSFTQGMLTNAMNPKAAVIFLTIIPQFLDTKDSTAGIVILAAVLATLALTWFCTYAFFIAAIRPYLQTRRAQRSIEGATGITLTGMGVRLALETR